ncbi:hypothetical protein, partial [uncultured Parasutterella sp.]
NQGVVGSIPAWRATKIKRIFHEKVSQSRDFFISAPETPAKRFAALLTNLFSSENSGKTFHLLCPFSRQTKTSSASPDCAH